MITTGTVHHVQSQFNFLSSKTCVAILLILDISKSSADTITYRSPEAVTLVRKLEELFCRTHDPGTIANEVEARVCIQGLTASGEISEGVCETNLMNSCECPGCVVCCKALPNYPNCMDISNYGINETRRGMKWSRQSVLDDDKCDKEDLRRKKGFAGWKLCAGDEANGKICGIYRKSNMEIPLVCRDSACQALDCSIFSSTKGEVEPCDCPKGDTRHTTCCKLTAKPPDQCLPFLNFLVNHTVRSNGLTTAQRQEQVCSSDQTCTCSPESGNECHRCCRDSQGFCKSMHRAGTSSFNLRSTGTVCTAVVGGDGFCDEEGVCRNVDEFCQRGANQDQICGPKHRCAPHAPGQAGQCDHVCGSENNECICAEPDECKVCCRSAKNASQCLSVYDFAHPNALVRSANTPCLGNKGRCSDLGKCKVRTTKRSTDNGQAALSDCKTSALLTLSLFVTVLLLKQKLSAPSLII